MSKTIEYKISETKLREIVAEELKKKQLQIEAVDVEGAANVLNTVKKLHKAVVAFKADANTALQNALGIDVDKMISTLEQIADNPGSYTDKVKVEPKRVKLRRVEESGTTKNSTKLDCPRCGETNPRTNALNGECAQCGEPLFPQKKETKSLQERSRYNWKPDATLFMNDILRTKSKTVPVGSKETKIADTLQDLGMLRVKKQFKGPTGLVVIYEPTKEGEEEFFDKGDMKA